MLRVSARTVLSKVKQCSWQQQRCFAEAAVAPKFDWDSLEGSVASEEGKRELASLRSTWIDVQQKFDSMSQSSDEIDWKSYAKEVDPQVLKLFKDSFASLDFPMYDASKLAEETDAKLSGLIKQAEELKAYSQKRMKELEKEIQDCEAAKEKVASATIDEELARDPETAKQIDQEISEGNFIP
ncbi:MAG: ATP synthase D mitochondrial [Trebouxia sp. A1-2]|nr:MAG: ATP synthase D mitochondrial [Trebouxia sp. A1-2]